MNSGNAGGPAAEPEITEDVAFQRRDRKAQRLAWLVMVALVGCALAGLFGSGPASARIAGDRSGPLWVEYQAFGRWQAPEELRVHLGPRASHDGLARVWLGGDLVDGIRLHRVTPLPERVLAQHGGLVYVFNAPQPDRPLTVTFAFEPERWGRSRGAVGLDAGETLSLDRLVYP